jgi:ketosteroid isomerase-like protein
MPALAGYIRHATEHGRHSPSPRGFIRGAAIPCRPRDTGRFMPEESTTPDLVELGRRSIEAGNSGDIDAIVSFFAPNAVWDLSPVGMGTFEGHAAIRSFCEDWFASYEEFEMKAEEIHDLGNGVDWAVIALNARPVGSSGYVQLRYAAVTIWKEGLGEWTTNFTDIDEARAAAERLAESRG